MSKILCGCGHTIVDQTDHLPFKAHYVKDQDVEGYYKYFDDVKGFLVALKKGNRIAWIQSNFGHEYPIDIDDASIIHDILLRDERIIYQCENCGRLLIQNWETNTFISFYPEDENSNGLFSKKI
jgi:hypothetical protein